MRLSVLLFFPLCLAAAVAPWCTTQPQPADRFGFPGWSAAPLPIHARPQPLGAREERFTRDFPGEIGAFANGAQTWIVRWVQHPTRKLHPASDCLRALGYRVKPGPVLLEPDGTRWGTATAQRGANRLAVQERIVNAQGQQWTDISAWFWHAALGRSVGPWWAVTTFRPVGSDAEEGASEELRTDNPVLAPDSRS